MNHCVGTTEAASLLGISSRRLRQLLEKGRVRGAYKSGKFWIIPLFKHLPQITKGTRGPKGKWRTSRPPALATINVNRNRIGSNNAKPPQDRQPVISVKRSGNNLYGNQIEILGPCRIVYQPDHPLRCGARLWIETFSDVHFIGGSFPASA
ncbi:MULTISPECIES: helix-turn-helix domain-containing protein [unclassified Moorena]|uniref:helix-turn-helix domain-containing protein n=1 Tax=unclassified Moorena TaxID=2683338 RepID=UPI0013BC875B|nr:MULTISPECIES: helix-turn-helix domain-containing protein [unclassified Moorena]NEP35338.1 DNA-binding protein [Moorena sp. SIO3B2]NER91529.1 DNA-binding protein [Moorena sp. SIO3A2]NES42162.1 DNA-binding protein [Moorena sp. SIO2C4]NET65469.1 DNA-binding protein [Moorena sp. SIO1G6]